MQEPSPSQKWEARYSVDDYVYGTDPNDFLVEAVVNGAEALKWLSSHSPPELILLDLMMPEVDGFHVITELQCRDDWRDIPVVVFTAMDVPPARQAFLEGHVDAVIRKGGVGTTQMLEEVGQLIARSIV